MATTLSHVRRFGDCLQHPSRGRFHSFKYSSSQNFNFNIELQLKLDAELTAPFETEA